MNIRSMKTVKYYSVPSHKKIVCTTQRTASASMVESIKPAFPNNLNSIISPAYVKKLKTEGYKALLWIRNPFDRIACAYHIFGSQYRSVDDFIENIIKITNSHWSPVCQLHSFAGVFLPTHVYPFDSLSWTWKRELPGFPLVYIGENPGRVQWVELRDTMNDKNFNRVFNHWSDDISLYRWANQEGCHKIAA